MSGFYPNVDPMYLFKRQGTANDPYIPLVQNITVKTQRVTLKEIPSYINKVKVSFSNGTALTEVTGTTINANEYRVDYSTGMVHFNSAENDKELKFEYLGTGHVNIGANRILLNTSATNNEEVSVQEIIDDQIDLYAKAQESKQLIETNQAAKKSDLQITNIQLAEAENDLKSIENANAENFLQIRNYLGNYQNIHPKPLEFKNGWNGFKYWMAYTPYPKGDTTAENPCIAVSNDLVNWVTPSGLSNPLDPAPSDGYNSDTHLVYREDTNTLEIWWRWFRASNNGVTIYRRTSQDGKNWTTKEVVIETTTANEIYSPAIIFEDGKYKIWFCRSQYVMYRESIGDTIRSWSTDSIVPIDWASQNLRPWHMDVIHTELGYEMVVQAFDKTTGNNNKSDLFYVLQKEDKSITKPKLILARSKNPSAIDYTTIYRSALMKVSDTYYLYYSCIDADNKRWMGLASGKSVSGLNGFKSNKRGSLDRFVTTGSTLSDYDVSDIDVLSISADTTINSFSGGYVGKKITLVVSGSATKVTLVNSSRLLLPSGLNYVLNYAYDTAVDIICTNANTQEWRVMSHLQNRILSVSGGTTLTDHDLAGVDTLLCSGSGVVTINSLVSSHVGKTINVVLGSSTITVKFTYGSRILTPGLADFTLDTSKLGMTGVCTSLTGGGVFRFF